MQTIFGERERKQLRAAQRREMFWAIATDLGAVAMSIAALIVACVALRSRP